MIFIGIDLAWTYKNETGLCIISDTGHVLRIDADYYSDDQLLDIIKCYDNEDLAIAIDAPLVVKNETGSRLAEGSFMRHKIYGHHLSVFAVSRAYLLRTYKVIRGEVLVEKIQRAIPKVQFRKSIESGKSTLFETFPSGICAGMFPDIYPIKYKVKSKVSYDSTYADMCRILDRIEKLVVDHIIFSLDLKKEKANLKKSTHKHLEDMVDAFLCAYGAYGMYKKFAKTLTHGSIEDGMIMMPEVIASDNKNKY